MIRTLGADQTFSNLSIYGVAQRVRASHGTEVINILAMSAGGADGAFGAGALVGLTRSESRPQFTDLVAKTIQTYGRLDVAFNNAGTEGAFTPFVEQSNQVYDIIFNANVRGVFWSMKHEARAMLAQGGGAIINNAP